MGDVGFLPNLPGKRGKKGQLLKKEQSSVLLPLALSIFLGVVVALVYMQVFTGGNPDGGRERRSMWNRMKGSSRKASLLQKGQIFMAESFDGSFPHPYSEGRGLSSVQVLTADPSWSCP